MAPRMLFLPASILTLSFLQTQAFVLKSPLGQSQTTTALRFTRANENNNKRNNKKEDDDNFLVGVLGDLHIDPRKLEDYEDGKGHFSRIFLQNQASRNAALVSLGDLGESKAVWPDSDELFAGTTACHEMAAEYLSSFGVPYEVVGGNHGT